MNVEVTIHMADFSGNFYTYSGYNMHRPVEDFGDAELDRWIGNCLQYCGGMLPYDGGYINVRVCSRVWYEVREVH
jgi:hypothetical protein